MVGHDAVTAGTAAEALRLCQREPFDLLICDLCLPDGDGWGLMGELLKRCDAPAIALAACCRPGDAERSRAAGFFAHVTKPFDLDDLARTIRRAPRDARGLRGPRGKAG